MNRIINLTKVTAVANQSGAMEADTILKNGAGLISLSIINFYRPNKEVDIN